jgi:hypothetical protein
MYVDRSRNCWDLITLKLRVSELQVPVLCGVSLIKCEKYSLHDLSGSYHSSQIELR